jgi:hypothetical protein
MLKRSLAILATVVLGTSAYAEVFYVSPQGDDKASGTLEQPWRTLRRSFSSLYPGDTLIVRGGLYEEVLGEQTPVKIRQGTAIAPIAVQAYPRERPVLKGLLWLSRPSYWTLDGINVTWQDGLSSRSHMVRLINGVGWKFRRAEVWGAKSYAGILVGSTLENEPSNWEVSLCTVRDTMPSNSTNQDHLIYVNSGLTAGRGMIRRNILYNASNGNGIKLGGASAGQGTQNVTVRYNTIYNTNQGILVSWLSQNNRIERNLIGEVGRNYGGIRGYQLDGGKNVARDNYIFRARHTLLNDAGYIGVLDGGQNIMEEDPLFESLTPRGFRPARESAQYYGRYATLLPTEP